MKRLAYRVGAFFGVLALLLVSLSLAWGQGEETATVTSLRAPLHTEPTAQAETLLMLPEGTLLRFFELDDSLAWAHVETPDGVSGWVSTFHLRLNGPYIPPEDGLTHTVVDGRADDWDRFTRPFTDEAGDSSGNVDILAVRSFMNDAYLYVLIEASGDLSRADLVLVDIVTNTDGNYRTFQYALPRIRPGTVFVVTEQEGEARDASGVVHARETAIEFRMPLELIDSPDTFNLVAVEIQESAGGGLTTTDRLEEVMPTVVTPEVEPTPNARVADVRLNLRTAPGAGRILRVLLPDEPLSLMARTEDNQWLLVRLADTRQGWVAAEYVVPEIDIASLPVES
ncbi:MAG: hypothetical protein Kow0063_02750 [Anaerolineae bacterium]